MFNVSIKIFASVSSSEASVTAVGKLLATSLANAGPDNTAIGLLGSISLTTSLINAQLVSSIPFEQITAGTPGGQLLAAASQTGRRNCAGVTKSTTSTFVTKDKSVVAFILLSSLIFLRNVEFSWFSFIALATSGSCAWIMTSFPARWAVIANAVPHAPAPMIPILLINYL